MMRLTLAVVASWAVGAGAVGRIVPLQNGWHLDDLMRDTRQDRPASLIMVYNSKDQGCLERWHAMDVNPHDLPMRAHLFAGMHDAGAEVSWWNHSHTEVDASSAANADFSLTTRFGVGTGSMCPALIYIPPVELVSADGLPLPRSEIERAAFWPDVDDPKGPGRWQDFLWRHMGLDVTVRNELDEPITVFPSKDDMFNEDSTVLTLAAGAEASIFTHVSRTLAAHAVGADGSRGELRARHMVLHPTGGASCEAFAVTPDDDGKRFKAEAAEARRLSQHYNWRDQDTSFDHSSMTKQPLVMPNFTTLGYAVLDMPPELNRTLREFYAKFDETRYLEEYGEEMTGINYHEVQTTMVSFDMDHNMRHTIADEMVKPLVEEWSGVAPLVHTSFYGIREYYRGSELRSHVDRVATHVLSVILNVDQAGVDEPWPLEIVGFDGIVREVLMKPGQIVFYESAKLIHGRPKPFKGERYANAFCHFKPVHGWDYTYEAGDMLHKGGEPLIDYKLD